MAFITCRRINSIIGRIQELHAELQKSAEHHKSVKELADRLKQLSHRAGRYRREMSALSEEVSYDPQKIEALNSRLSLI
ncbi:MAG: hypothetical protein U5L09_05235 [Bacteroidales bacterium]|nr:hypothetical protein [Bacteroidales bacterium]